MTPEREAEIRMAVAEADPPDWMDRAAIDLLAEIYRLREIEAALRDEVCVLELALRVQQDKSLEGRVDLTAERDVARAALRDLVDALPLDDRPRTEAIRRARETLARWGMR